LRDSFTLSLLITSMTNDNKEKELPITHEELVSEMLKNPEVLAEYELNKSTGAVQRVDNDRRS
jgi:hypothetical protein